MDSPARKQPPVSKPPLRLTIWLLVLLAGLGLLARLMPVTASGSEIAYSDLTRELARGNVAGVEINTDERQAGGQFRTPVLIGANTVKQFRVALPFEDPAPLVARLEAQGVPIRAVRPASWLAILLSVLPWLLIGGVWLLVARQTRAVSAGALSFGRAGAKQVSREQPQVTFADVAGADEAKAELQEVIDFLREPSRFQRVGGRLPKGVLLVGPPGTGKTLLARAVAGEAGVAFFSISGSDFVELFVGVGAARVRSLFEQGKANAPCIIFIDELDAVGRQRGVGLTGVHEEREQTLNQLLVELDGFEPAQGVIVLSATNRPDVLDPALLRPGRFDRQVVVELPDVRAREQILAVHARKIRLAENVDLAGIARGTPGLSGADLANLVNEAALFAARRNKDQADRQDFADARDKVMLGIERRSLVLTPEDRQLAAYHEAGHALVNLLIPGLDPVQKVTIVPRGRALGITFSLPEQDRRSYTKAYLLGRLAVAYGGRAAEEIVFGPERVTTGAANDLEQATDLARQMVTRFGMSDALGPITVQDHAELGSLGRDIVQRLEVSPHTAELVDDEVRRLAQDARLRAANLIATNRATLDRLAAALLEHETLERAEVEAILRAAAPARAA
ncbi:MAG TPA: ATP-dependent zinc metalloprotease FtsH [Gemmatimonadales bacterium]|nr:ATP-dependent zinc metalloprotease FtsH [Gemmatimonadales bacterium]